MWKVITVYPRAPDIDGYWGLSDLVIYQRPILRVPALMWEVITVHPLTPDIDDLYWCLSYLLIYQLYKNYQP
jgi:hypothetical protein